VSAERSKQVKGQRQARVWAKARVPYPHPCPGTAGWREEQVLHLAPPLSPHGTALGVHPWWTLQSSSNDGSAQVLQWDLNLLHIVGTCSVGAAITLILS